MSFIEHILKLIQYLLWILIVTTLMKAFLLVQDADNKLYPLFLQKHNQAIVEINKLEACLSQANEFTKKIITIYSKNKTPKNPTTNTIAELSPNDISNSLLIRMPVRGHVNISSGFGYRADPISGRRKFHNGIDIKLKTGTSILATGGGVVQQIGYDRFLGNFIIINHQKDYQSIYGHLSSILVHKNQKVTTGQSIGYSGNSGRSTGPHLHYQINHKGKPVDPIEMFRSLNAKAG
jgi:murein DD-endopeptidase MepM/ murein hydrolase activator NlpD